MKFSTYPIFYFLFLLFSTFLIYSCQTDENIVEEEPEIEAIPEIDPEKMAKIFMDKSNTPPLVDISKNFSSLEAFAMVSTTDTLGGNFRIGGTADGSGFLEDGDDFIYVVNFESDRSIGRIRFDEFLNPISGDYLLDAGVADYARQCSGTMWESAIHGGGKDIFLSASESYHYQVKALDPRIEIPTPTASFGLEALGEFAWENAVPLPQKTYPGKTVILGGDDDSTDSAGQVVLYYSENGDADFDNGKIYVLRTKQVSDGSGSQQLANSNEIYTEASFDFRKTYEIEFVEIENGRNLTQTEMENACIDNFATQFMRVEDLDYQKGKEENARNIFFAVTGGGGPASGTYNDWGTVYKLELDNDSPLTGKLTQIISGNTNTNNRDGNLGELESPDNLCVTENFVYIQEDPRSFLRGHSARIYQSSLNGDNIKTVMEIAPRSNGQFKGEYGSLIDISDKVGIPDTFMLAIMPKREIKSQIILLKGLPR
ncbi:hypothetical protein [Gillisia hiemivivida]|uniref:DUF839 domain-containing protein n=1 Tax=Gillisia hiemivivida TaxID=291190 RepID=A0A5C6ZPY9_9FLAO|nr:hypothetical protein [Gillisia hiemivivida]TXD92847.1 hypothetical protein ES724_12220 [Gillisia hiemivivida]